MKWNKSNNYAHLQAHFLSHPAGQVIGVQSLLDSSNEKRDKKISETAEQLSEPGATGFPLGRLCRSICGQAPLFRSSPQNPRGYAARPEAEPRESLVSQTVKQTFTANRTTKPFRSVKICPTKISKTAEQAFKTLGASILLVCLSLTAVFAQEKPKAIQIDAFGVEGCESLYARSHNLQTVLKQNPSATGVVILHPQTNSPSTVLRYKNFIEKVFQLNEWAYDRLKIVQGPAAASPHGEFWLVPPTADDPSFGMDLWPDKALDLSKSFIYGLEDEDGICPTFVPRLYADLIKSNPGILGRIVIIPNSAAGKSRKYEFGKEWIDTFTSKYGLPRNRLRLVFAKDSDYEIVQFWIVPKKKR